MAMKKSTEMSCQRILDAMAMGEPLVKIAAREGVKPSAIYKREESDSLFAAAMERARADRANFYADQIIGIADDETIEPLRARNMIESRKWVASKLLPTRFAERGGQVSIEISGQVSIAGAISRANERAATVIDVTPTTPADDAGADS